MKYYILKEDFMKKFSFGLFVLVLLIANQLGSMLGVAIALCVWMMTDGLIEEFVKRQKNKTK